MKINTKAMHLLDENEYWFRLLKNLTENAYKTNNNTPITYVAHSLGGKMLLHFLQKKPQQWKNKYVKQVITLAVPWGGSSVAVQAASIEYDLGFAALPNENMNQIQRTFPSIAWLMPSKYFWKPHEMLATIGERSTQSQTFINFSSKNFHFIIKFGFLSKSYFSCSDIDVPDMVDMIDDLVAYNSFRAPGVKLHCLYGTNTDTVER